uniref:TIR domain-containing protein n=2 Tax=Chrysotila carterae TaxID=13221 RepID=A0A7S4BYN7_CHRCT
MLATNRKAIGNRAPNEASKSIEFLHRDYDHRFFWWEPIELLRKLCLTGVPLLIGTGEECARVVLALMVSLLSLAVHVNLQPYKRSIDNKLCAFIQVSLVFIYLTVLLIKVCELSEEVCETFGFDSEGDVFLFFTVASTSTLVVVFGMGITQIVYSSSHCTPLLKLQDDLTRPELTAMDQLGFHLFLSHVWQSGQDQVALIKRQLQLCLPGTRIFLDVDDLLDISELEAYVKSSAVVLIFLSKGYFVSRNCLREAGSSEKENKPIVLVHEADLSKGGITLEDSRAECPEKLRSYVFKDRNIIRWHRIADFQKLSLKLIADGMLRGSSAYAHVPFDPLAKWLVFPGETSIEKLRLDPPLALQYSSFNPGARELAQELKARLAGLKLMNVRDTPIAHTPSGDLRRSNSGESVTSIGPLMLYLNNVTFLGEEGAQLAQTVRAARAQGTRIVLFHENDEAFGGGPFSWHFTTTPSDLISDGIFSDIAVEFFTMPHREVSLALAAQALIAQSASSQKRNWGTALVRLLMVRKAPALSSRASSPPPRASTSSSRPLQAPQSLDSL